MLAVSVEKNFGSLADEKLLTREDWAATGRLARESIIRHTTAGTDEDGKPFAPYAKSYAQRRRKEGLSERVSLQLSGGMLQAIGVEADDTGVNVGFTR